MIDCLKEGAFELESAVGKESIRKARILETRLLLGIMSPLDGFEDDCDELAVHYSVDVAIPETFVRWLRVLGGRGEEVLEILGLDGEESDGQETLWPLNDCKSSLVAEKMETPSKKSGGANLIDQRFHVEIDRDSPSQTKSPRPKLVTPRKKKIIDSTVILETPPKLLDISRSSTPGCSQRIHNLSLEDC